MAGRHVTILYGVLLAAASAAAGAWYAGSRIESPADAAARTAPPPPSPILVPVEEKVLSAEIITRGTARFGLPQPVSLAPSPLKAGPGLITALPARNAPLNEGDVMLSASGRPVFVLRGDIPAYRDLVPGVSGDDVRQLKQALKRLGFDPGSDDGLYDPRTSDAVAQWYRAKGWEAFGPTRDQLAALRTLEREHQEAVRAKFAAEAAGAAADLAINASRATASHQVRTATLENSSRILPRSAADGSVPSAVPLAVETERAKAEYANTAAEADFAAQIADRAIIVLDPRQTDTARAAAEAKVQVARAARERIRLEGQMAIQAAERETMMVSNRMEIARGAAHAARLEGERNVRAAQDARKLAAIDIGMATARADQAAADLAAAKGRLGVQIPLDEVVFIRNLPVRVEEVSVTVGGHASGQIMTVTDNQVSIDSSLALDAAPLVQPGMPVAIDEQALGVKATGTVELVANTPGTRGVDGYHFYMGVRVDPTPIRLEGFSLRLTIPIQSTKGAVTAVPVSALSLSTDGSSRVQVARDGVLEYVTVRPGLTAGGLVEVAATDRKLAPGQLVVVGYGNREATQ